VAQTTAKERNQERKAKRKALASAMVVPQTRRKVNRRLRFKIT